MNISIFIMLIFAFCLGFLCSFFFFHSFPADLEELSKTVEEKREELNKIKKEAELIEQDLQKLAQIKPEIKKLLKEKNDNQ